MRLKFLMLGVVAMSVAACAGAPISDSASPPAGFGLAATPVSIDRIDRTVLPAAIDTDSTVRGYKVGPHDVLDITVYKVPELSKSVQVSEAGTINYPLIGETIAAGNTARDLEMKLTKILGAKYLQDPQVSIMVRQFNSQRVTIEGAVKKPGIYPLQGSMTLLQAIATAQGLAQASNNTVVVFRQLRSMRKAERFAVSELRDGSVEDPELKAGDVIVAPASATQKMFNNLLKALPIAGVFALL